MEVNGKEIAEEAASLASLHEPIPYKAGGEDLRGMDCQGLVEYVLRRLGMKASWSGSNAMYRSCIWVGTPEECKSRYGAVPPGALIFILEFDGKEPAKYRSDGIGNAGHVGIYTSMGLGAVHASSRRSCVCESKFNGRTVKNGGWNRVGLLDQVNYWEEKPVETAIVMAPDGDTVNLRDEPRKSGQRLNKMPVGSVVEVITRGSEWSKIRFKGTVGFVMSEFLADENAESADGDLIQVSKAELMDVYHKIGALIGERSLP